MVQHHQFKPTLSQVKTHALRWITRAVLGVALGSVLTLTSCRAPVTQANHGSSPRAALLASLTNRPALFAAVS